MEKSVISPGVKYLHEKIEEANQAVALLLEQNTAQAARIAELEKNQRKPRKTD